MPAQATFIGQNGKIAFLTSGSNCLQMVNPDGTGQTQPGACNITSLAAISPGGDRVVTPVYNGDYDAYDWRNSKLDGTDAIAIPGFSYEVPVLAWSHDGKWISGVTEYTCAGLCGRLHVALADGTGGLRYLDDATPGATGSWGSGGRIAYGFILYIDPGGIRTSAPDGTPSTLMSGGESPDWSPGSDRIVLERNGIAVINADGSGLHNLTSAADSGPKWSPDGQKILFSSFRDGNYEIYVMNPDGTGQTNLTGNPAIDSHPIWSPDSKQIAFGSNRDGDANIYVMNRDGSGVIQVTNGSNDSLQDWQSIPINAYPRPKGATPFLTYLVPAYNACASPNRQHGPPLAFASCNPPTQSSDQLTIGSADSNGKPTKSVSSVRFDTVLGIPSAADEADVKITAQVIDVYTLAGLNDYAGEVTAKTTLRITDKLNTPHPGGPGAGTVSDIPYGFTIPCAATADTTIGGSCLLSTSADALTPGAVKEGRRSIWALGQVAVYDANDAPFMKQGIFVP